MFKYLKIITFLFIILYTGLIFASSTDWIVFPDSNRRVYPIVFGKMDDPTNIIDCTDNFSSSFFAPTHDSNPVNLTSYCIKQSPNIFFYIRNKPNQSQKDISQVIAENFVTNYYFFTTFKYNQDQNKQLVFTFRES